MAEQAANIPLDIPPRPELSSASTAPSAQGSKSFKGMRGNTPVLVEADDQPPRLAQSRDRRGREREARVPAG
jgi:hypothetical protein